MAKRATYQELLACLDDTALYTLFLTGHGSYEGSFRIDRCRGSEIKHNHHLFDSYRDAEIFPEPPDADEEQRRAAEAVIPHRIECTIKEHYRRLHGERGMRACDFEVLRVGLDGRYSREDLGGEELSRGLKSLVRESRTLSIVEKGSRAERLLNRTLESTEAVRLHPRERLFSELSDDEKELLAIDGVDADALLSAEGQSGEESEEAEERDSDGPPAR